MPGPQRLPASADPGVVAPGAQVDGDHLELGVADPAHRLAGVRLWQDVGLPGDRLVFTPVEGGWRLRLPAPPVRRLQYLLELRHPDGRTETVPDPSNPLRARGVFGDQSVVEMPGYAPPSWLGAPTVPGRATQLTVSPARGLRRDLPVTVWQPADVADTDPLPLLVVHDGLEMAALAAMTTYSAAGIADGALPVHRVALLHPLDRDAWYSASPAYARSLARAVLPALRERFAVSGPVAAAGASLGALSAFHTEWSHPGTFGGLFCQSGSFFRIETDPQEEGYSRFWRLHRFVSSVLAAPEPPSRPQISLTCGALEENVHNNRALARWLHRAGYPVVYAEVADVHTFTAWRDAFDPHLTDLLQRTWGHRP